MKKNFIFHFDELAAMANTITEYDEQSATAFICLLIDTVARTSAHTAPEIANTIAEAVQGVNAELGAY